MSVGQTCEACGGQSHRAARYCQWCGEALRELEGFETEDLDADREYVDIRELHPACVKLPCRYEACDNERWVCGSGSTKDYTVCENCGPDIDHLFGTVTVRL